ncbi:DUF5719 family protein [Bifidobacterium oedipodis]|uniref:Organic solvents resistance ABC transporter permease n=1 Tax=Bifidobacterium oedipodis TaxID=2675322 RepID=A0A7Y0HSF1_9BIFI|nr:DUF5719 family protein [Bifidobacterium sp. DSM 109957]NMM93528.1 hypothetical protein [Bifidobacterium sp. DSM 109957]
MTTTGRRVLRVVIGFVTMVILIAVFAALAIMPGPAMLVDRVSATDNAIDETVSPTQSQQYCPSPMGLLDTGTYGDSAFQATSGDLSTQASYAAFGSVYSATASAFGQDAHDANVADVNLKDGDPGDDAAVKTGSQRIDQGSRLIETHMLQAQQGTGTVGAIASWSTDGDLKGVSAASCETTSLEHDFLLSGSATGTTQQLIVANPSSKPTSVRIRVWGSNEAGELTMSTQSSVAVSAGGEASLDLSAAASDVSGLYVTVSSKQTPIAALVRTVVMDGLTSKGSDFAMPLAAAANASAVSGITQGDSVTAYLFSQTDTVTQLSWITSHGLVEAHGDVSIQAGKVEVVDLGEAPDDALGVMSTAQDAVSFSAKATRSGDDGQADFALINAGALSKVSGLALPSGFEGTVTLANTANTKQDATLTSYDDSGALLVTRRISLGANAADAVALDDLTRGDATVAALQLEDESGAISWGARISHADLDDGIAGLSTIASSALMPLTTQVWARNNPSIVR